MSETGARRPWVRRLSGVLVHRYVLVAFVLQTVSFAVLTGFFEHGPVTPLVAFVRGAPAGVGVVVGLFAVPAVVVTVAVGVGLESLFGVSLSGFGVGVVSESDGLFLAVAYVLSVVAVALGGRYRRAH